MAKNKNTLSGRRELLFLYDIKMGNPNGDVDENRPRILPDGTNYVTDVRLKRFVRDFLKSMGHEILVDSVEGRVTNLTGRVADYLSSVGKDRADGKELVDILLDAFIDARLFGSSFAFKAAESESEEEDESSVKGKKKAKTEWAPKPEPKTMTGAFQLNMGEVLHKAQNVDIHGTSIFASKEENKQGTFTTYFGLRYALIGFSGVANEHSAEISRMTDDDYEILLRAIWHGVRSAGNSRTKVGQIPHLLISVEYNPGEEFQFGRLQDYVKLIPSGDKAEKGWSLPQDYKIDLSLLFSRISQQNNRIKTIRYAKSPDVSIVKQIQIDDREPEMILLEDFAKSEGNKWVTVDIEDLTGLKKTEN